MYERIAEAVPGVSTISLTSAVCPDTMCKPEVNGVVLRWDGVHFTKDGAGVMKPELQRQILALGVMS